MTRRELCSILAGPAILGAAPQFKENPFALGVASGDPSPRGFVLWTRILGTAEPVKVIWELATDEAMRNIIRRGSVRARAEWGHSVHVELDGLDPDRWYFYRFVAGRAASPIGRTRTAPLPVVNPGRLRFAFASCQHYEQGWFTALRHLASEELDLVIHLGDYIYEGDPQEKRPRKHGHPEPKDLDGYRARYTEYKRDPELQEAHRMFPWVATWDDHEVENNYAGLTSENNDPLESFRARRDAAYRVYWENLPLRRAARPHKKGMTLYRALDWGTLARFAVVDTRQYRSDQACGDGNKPPCPAVADPQRTMLGKAQEKWLRKTLHDSPALWNVLANQVMVVRVDRQPGAGEEISMDKWSGYEPARQRLLADLERTRNPVVLTGDNHQNWAADLRRDGKVVATEFVGTSITSGGDGQALPAAMKPVLAENPDVRFFNSQRGYVTCEATPREFTAGYRVVDYVSRPGATIRTAARFRVRAGNPGIE